MSYFFLFVDLVIQASMANDTIVQKTECHSYINPPHLGHEGAKHRFIKNNVIYGLGTTGVIAHRCLNHKTNKKEILRCMIYSVNNISLSGFKIIGT